MVIPYFLFMTPSVCIAHICIFSIVNILKTIELLTAKIKRKDIDTNPSWDIRLSLSSFTKDPLISCLLLKSHYDYYEHNVVLVLLA